MSTAAKLLDLLKDLGLQLPSMLAIVGCLIFAVVRWKRFPKVALMVSIGLVLLLLHTIVFSVVYNWVPDMMIRSAALAGRENTVRNVYLVLGLTSNGALSVALAVLIAGIFVQRPAAVSQ